MPILRFLGGNGHTEVDMTVPRIFKREKRSNQLRIYNLVNFWSILNKNDQLVKLYFEICRVKNLNILLSNDQQVKHIPQNKTRRGAHPSYFIKPCSE